MFDGFEYVPVVVDGCPAGVDGCGCVVGCDWYVPVVGLVVVVPVLLPVEFVVCALALRVRPATSMHPIIITFFIAELNLILSIV